MNLSGAEQVELQKASEIWMPSGTVRPGLQWSNIAAVSNSTLSRNQNDYALAIDVPGLGPVNVVRDSFALRAVIKGHPTKPRWLLMYTQGPNDTVIENEYESKTQWIDSLLKVAPLIVLGAAAAGYAFGDVAVSGASSASSSISAGDLFANESAKLLQQQALAQSGVDLLSTSIPTINLNSAASSLANVSNISSASSASSFLPSSATLSSVAAGAKGLLAAGVALNNFIAKNKTGTALPGSAATLLPASGAYVPAVQGSGPSQNTIVIAAVALAALLFMSKGKK